MEYYDDVIRAREVIKKKYNALRRGETEQTLKLEKHFKPVAEPLKAILKMKDAAVPLLPVKKEEQVPKLEEEEEPMTDDGTMENEEDEEGEGTKNTTLNAYVESKFGPLTGPYFYRMIKAGSKGPTEYDHLYGVRHGGGTVAEWMIGSKPVSFDKDDTLHVDGEPFVDLTPGLLELIFKRSPREYTTEDLEEYKRMLEKTNAHRVSYSADKPIRATRANKYTKIIRVLFPPRSSATTAANKISKSSRATPKKKIKTAGSGLFLPSAQKRSYVYWDDPNELVERLELLCASKGAGHTGLEREILSIEEELREGGYIL